ncbi:Ig-like domain-containing protein [Microbulbifer taiwanensis]|uniref:Ig-like domain-containing protein n=3 Tax=Microbulbifer taiwanensis TaxID=986746 RepID=A0ABW1YRS1_9GAMM
MSGSGSSGGAGGGDTSRSITAVDDEFLMDEDGGSLTANVLANDKIGGKLISLEVVDGPASGEVSVVSNAESSGVERFSLLYTPAPNFNGSDHFRYRITGEDNSSATAAVAITVDPVTDISNFKVEPGGDGANPKLLKFSWASDSNPHHFVLEVNPDGKSGYKEVDIDGEIAGDSTVVEVEMPLHLMHWELARYQLVAVGEGGDELDRSEEVSIADVTVESMIGYFKASNTSTGAWDRFGFSLALSGDGRTMAAGAPPEASGATGIDGDQGDNNASYSGAVYVFSKGEHGWAQQAYIKASNTDEDDAFGWSVALSQDGNTLAVSASMEGSSAKGVEGDQGNDEIGKYSGAVYVFSRTGEIWQQSAYIKASNTDYSDGFGESLALAADGETLVVGAAHEDSSAAGINGEQADNSANGAGAAYIFRRREVGWFQEAYIKASNSDASDRFGQSVALSDDANTLAVGAPYESSATTGVDGEQDDNAMPSSGAVYIFVRELGGWSQQAYIKASNPDIGDRFGFGLALSGNGNSLAVSAPYEGSAATGVNGDQVDNSASGSSDEGAGAAYVFVRSDGGWTQEAYIKASNTDASDQFGESLSLSGDGLLLVVGAPEEDSGSRAINGGQDDNSYGNAGAAYLYQKNGNGWSHSAYIKAPNTGRVDFFGSSVALSGDGEVLAVGADMEWSIATGVGGNQRDDSAYAAGAVYLY